MQRLSKTPLASQMRLVSCRENRGDLSAMQANIPAPLQGILLHEIFTLHGGAIRGLW
jgi:hypothetical protein